MTTRAPPLPALGLAPAYAARLLADAVDRAGHTYTPAKHAPFRGGRGGACRPAGLAAAVAAEAARLEGEAALAREGAERLRGWLARHGGGGKGARDG